MLRIQSRVGLLTAACVGVLFSALLVVRARWHHQIAEAKTFCEAMIPIIQQARSRDGTYPKQADPTWWAGRVVPALIRTQDFYLSADGSAFLLRFRDPTPDMDDIWGFSSREMAW